MSQLFEVQTNQPEKSGGASQNFGTLHSGLKIGISLRSSEWIEQVRVSLPPELKAKFVAPTSRPDDPWRANLDLLRGESILIDNPMEGGCMGYRAFQDLATQVDRPVDELIAPAAHHLNDLLKAALSGVELTEMYGWYQSKNLELTAN